MTRLIRLTLRFFPAPFRAQFGAEIAEQIEHDYAHARARGRLTAAGFVFATAWDLARSAVAERWNPT